MREPIKSGVHMKAILKIAVAVAIILVITVVGLVADANLRIAGDETLAPEVGAPGRFVMVDGRRLHVATIGDISADPTGAPLMLIHGFAAPGHVTWLPWASRLTAERALIMPDLMGFGHSARIMRPDAAYTLKSRSAALAVALDSLGIAQVDIVSESYGGAVAAQFALDYPARVRRIVFMGAMIYPQPDPFEPSIDVRFGIGRAIAWHVLSGGPFSFVAQNCKGQANCRWLRLTRVTGTTDALRAMSYTQRHSPEGAALVQDIAKITAPALVIWGGNDRFVPVSEGDRLARQLNSSIAIIADAGHMPYIEQPEKVAARVLAFLKPR